MLCGARSLVNSHGRGEVAISLVCRSWLCSTCAPERRRQLIKLAEKGAPTRLVTLTVNPTLGVSPADRAAKLARAWRVIVARAKRQLKLPTIDYLAVFEATKRGEPHLHILVRSNFIPQRWLSEQSRDIIGSPIVDIRKVSSASHAARYVAKYIGKAPHRFATCKRYWHTRNWVIGAPEPEKLSPWSDAPWVIDERPVWIILEDWQANYRHPCDAGDGVVYWGTPPPWLQEKRAQPP